MTHILEEDLQSMLEQMLQLSLDSPQDSEPSDQIAAAAPPLVATPGPDAADNSLGNPSVEWAEMLLGEMARAATVDDARSLAVRILEAFGDSVIGSRAAKVIGDKDRVLGAALQQNTILKRAVIVQHRRHLEGEEKTKELHGMVAEYREKVRQLEISNYALSMHLRNAGSGSSMPGPGNYNPKVF